MTLRPPLTAVVTLLAVLSLGAAVLPVTAAAAADAVATTTTLAGEPRAEGNRTPLTAELTTEAGEPLAGRTVVVERRAGEEWTEVATVVTDDAGTATTRAVMSRWSAANTFRARYAGEPAADPAPDQGAPDATSYAPSGSGPVPVALVRRASRLVVDAPESVVDERRITLALTRRTGEGEPVPGWVSVQRRAGKRWVAVGAVRLGSDGRGSLRQRPRVDTTYRAVARAQDWVAGDATRWHRVDNLPPGEPVRLPAAAPRPRISLPPQARATTEGADPRVTRIPDRVWRDMTGVSWHRGCPVGRAGLRLVRVNYWGYDGYRHRGEIVVASWAARRTADAFAAMYRRELPIRSMYRVDRFGWSRRLQGGNDYRSMAAGNTSGFNCRSVVNNPGVRSPHSYGGSVDVNTWENPYLSRTGWTPNAWWGRRSHGRIAWRSRNHPVVRLWLAHGFRWTYGVGDSQHFDAVRGSGRVIAPRGCAGPCH